MAKSNSNLREFQVNDFNFQSQSTDDFTPGRHRNSPKPANTPTPQDRRPQQNVNASTEKSSNFDELWEEWNTEVQHEQGIRSPVKAKQSVKSRVTPALQSIDDLEPKTRRLTTKENVAALPGKPDSWIVKLAMDERRMEKSGSVDFTNHFQKHVILKDQTLEFLTSLKTAFAKHLDVFNDSRRSPGHAIKVYRVSGTAKDFMLFRNGVKLIISGLQAGKIQFVFNQYLGQVFAPNQKPSVEIEAAWGAFDQLVWTYRGERIQIEDIVRYFLTEFIRQSAR